MSALTDAERRAFETYGKAAAMIRSYVAGASCAKDPAFREHVTRTWSEIAEEIRAADAELFAARAEAKVKLDLIRLGEQLAEEQATAHDLWTWLPSHVVAEKHHGDYASEHCPSTNDVMKEAAMYLGHLKHPDVALTPEEEEWFTSCPCGEDHAST